MLSRTFLMWAVVTAILVPLTLNEAASGQIATSWISNSNTEFGRASNWTNGVPGPNDTAVFDIGVPFKVTMTTAGEIRNFDHVAGEINLQGGFPLTVRNPFDLNSLMVLDSSAVLEAEKGFNVGDSNVATVDISDNSQVLSGANVVVGQSSFGTVNISNSDLSSDQLYIANNSDGEVNMMSRSSITADEILLGNRSGWEGEINTSGVAVSIDARTLILGVSGRGEVNLTGQATLEADQVCCGGNAGSVGVIVVEAGSSIDIGDVELGRFGGGAIGVLFGGTATARNVDIGTFPGSGGGVAVEGGSFTCRELNVGIAGQGEILIRENGSVFVSNGTKVFDGSTIRFADSSPNGLLSSARGISVEGSILFDSGNASIIGDIFLQGDGEMVAEAQVSLDGDVLHNGDSICVNAPNAMKLLGNCSGTGYYDGDGTLMFMGDLEPGDGGVFISEIEPAIDLSSSSNLKMELSGTALGQYDRIESESTINLQNGSLTVSLVGGYLPSPGDEFEIVSADGSVNGQFAGVPDGTEITAANSNATFKVNYVTNQTPELIVLNIGVIPVIGDVDGDGVVGLTDVAGFVDAILTGTYFLEADINLDGAVDLLDIQGFVDLILN